MHTSLPVDRPCDGIAEAEPIRQLCHSIPLARIGAPLTDKYPNTSSTRISHHLDVRQTRSPADAPRENDLGACAVVGACVDLRLEARLAHVIERQLRGLQYYTADPRVRLDGLVSGVGRQQTGMACPR